MKSYQDFLRHIYENGNDKGDRTGTGTRSVFGGEIRHNVAKDGFPLMTLKKVHLKSIIHELLWFFSGDTNIKYLKENGVRIWDEWATEDGELNHGYAQWVNWKTKDGGFINQIEQTVELLRHNPNSRRILYHGWNPETLPDESKSPQENVLDGKNALPPCHLLYQYYVHDGKLSAQLYIRSSDTFLGLPFNIASLALKLLMFAQQANLTPWEIIISFGDAHIYNNHFAQVEEILKREPKKLPTMRLARKPDSIFDYKYDDFILEGYDPHPAIKGKVAV